MDIDTARVRDLLDRREKIDDELKEIFAGVASGKTLTSSLCQSTAHTARTCPTKVQSA